MKVVTEGFDIDWNQLSRAKSLRWTIENGHYSSLCNSQQLTQPPLALSVPLSRFTPRIGGGSAFFVRPPAHSVKLRFIDKRVEWEGGHLDLPTRILDAVRLGDTILVIHDYMAYPLQKPAPNLVAYTTRGEQLWTAENPTQDSATDAYVNFCSEDPHWVGNFMSFNCRIEPQTGRLLERVFLQNRWPNQSPELSAD